jgi:hypothetical protein
VREVRLYVKVKFLVLQNVWSSATQCDRRCAGPMSACLFVGLHLFVARKVFAMTVTYIRSCGLKLIRFMYQYITVLVFPVGKLRPGSAADHSLPSSADVMDG